MDEEVYLLRGPALLNLIKYIKERRGQDGVDHIFLLLTKEAPDLYISPNEIKSKGWYSNTMYAKLLELLDREYGQGDFKEVYNFGFYDAHNLGVMGFFISFLGTPTKVIEKAPSSWKSYRKGGELVVTKLEPGLGIIEIRDFQSSKAVCTEILGYFNGAADQTRGKNVKVKHTRCTSQGDPVCEYTITWDE